MVRGYVPFDARATPRPDEPFRASVVRRWLGDIALIETMHGRGRGRRGRQEIDGSSGDLLGLMIMRRGRLAMTLGDASVVVTAGQGMIWDGGRQGSFEALGPIEKRTLLIPRERLRQIVPNYEAVLGRVLQPSSPQLRLLSGFLDTVVSVSPGLDAAGGSAVRDAVLDLARAVAGTGLPPGGAAGFHAALRVQAMRTVVERLADPSLTPEQIAHAHAVSLRTLQRAFSDEDEGISAAIRRMRLERCHADLSAGHGTVTEVAFRWGFRDSAHFSRAFRRHFGCSPRDVHTRA